MNYNPTIYFSFKVMAWIVKFQIWNVLSLFRQESMQHTHPLCLFFTILRLKGENLKSHSMLTPPEYLVAW